MASGKTVVVSGFEEPAETVFAGQNMNSPAISPDMEKEKWRRDSRNIYKARVAHQGPVRTGRNGTQCNASVPRVFKLWIRTLWAFFFISEYSSWLV